MTVKLSYDDCKTWPVSKTIHPGKAGYSDMIVSDKGTVMCVFESGTDIYAENITLVRFNIEWLESGFQPRIDAIVIPAQAGHEAQRRAAQRIHEVD